MTEKIGKFFSHYGGFIIGIIVGIIVVAFGIIDAILTIAVIVGFGLLGAYIQKNKNKVKEVLKNLIEKW